MEELRRAAVGSVARGCGFGALAIACTMIGFVDLSRAMLAGGVLFVLMTLILIWKGNAAPSRPYKRAEAWLMLDPAKRPGPDQAQRVLGGVLREVYLRFAQITAAVAAALLILALISEAVRLVA
jgi:hypothetical protein